MLCQYGNSLAQDSCVGEKPGVYTERPVTWFSTLDDIHYSLLVWLTLANTFPRDSLNHAKFICAGHSSTATNISAKMVHRTLTWYY